jgi:outer membrane receptor for ferrienterochelin and colicins
VFSASRRPERVVEAPAAVTVATEQEIAAAAPAGQAPRIIESAPGVDFTQSGLYDFNFNTRGFNSSLNRRVLTLIDGRDPSVPFLGAQEWAALSYPIDEFSNVELVRGPGSALYGPNAFAGVLNMTTKRPSASQGGRLMLTGGELNTRRADIRHAGTFGGEWFYRVTAGAGQSDDFTRSRNAGVEYAGLPAERVPLAKDDVKIQFGGLRLDHNFSAGSTFTVEGGLASLAGPTFQTGIGRVQVTDVKHPWARVNFNATHWNFLAYYDARKAEDQVALASGASLWEDSHNINAELQTNWEFGSRLRVAGGIAANTQEVDTANDLGIQTLMDAARSEDQQAAFAQAEFDVTKALRLVVAGRYDTSSLHEDQFSPKASLVYQINDHNSLRYGYNEAFQRPNYSEMFLSAPAGAPVNLAGAAAGNPLSAPLVPALTALGFGPMPVLARGNANLEVEKVKSHEVGYSGIFGGKAFVTVDYYRSQLSNFVTDLLPGVNPTYQPYQIPTTLPAPVQAGIDGFLRAALKTNFVGLTTVNGKPALVLSYANAGQVDTQGVEFAVNYYLTNRWLLDFNYAWFDFDVKEQAIGDALLPNSPEHKYNAGISWRGDRFDAKLGYRWIDEFPWAAGIFKGDVPSYDVVNLSGTYRINSRFSVGADISNLLDNDHRETFGGDILHRRALAFVTVNW